MLTNQMPDFQELKPGEGMIVPHNPGTYQDHFAQHKAKVFDALIKHGFTGLEDALDNAMNDTMTWFQDSEKFEQEETRQKARKVIMERAKTIKKKKKQVKSKKKR